MTVCLALCPSPGAEVLLSPLLCLVSLRSGFSEASLNALPAEQRKDVALSALRAFNIFQFWPEATGASLHAVHPLTAAPA